MVYLGIDPGFQYAGFGIAKKEGAKVWLLDYGYLQMAPTKHLSERINIFYEHFNGLIIKHGVNILILETPFLGKNAQNFLKLGYLRGILYLLSSQHKLQILEYSPTQVKQAVTGYGGASKDQVARVIKQLFPKLEAPKREDVTDALAVMLCGIWQKDNLLKNARV